jgi:hypothetical protein
MAHWKDAIAQGYSIDHPSGSFVIGDPQGPYDMYIVKPWHTEEGRGTLDAGKVDQYLSEAGINDEQWTACTEFAPSTPVEELGLIPRNPRRFMMMKYHLTREDSLVTEVRVSGRNEEDCESKLQVYLAIKELHLHDLPCQPFANVCCYAPRNIRN